MYDCIQRDPCYNKYPKLLLENEILDDWISVRLSDAYSTSFFTLNYNHLHEVIRVLNSRLPPLRPYLHFDQYLTKLVCLNCISIIILWLNSELNWTIHLDPNYCFNVVSCCSAFQSIRLNVFLWMTLDNKEIKTYQKPYPSKTFSWVHSGFVHARLRKMNFALLLSNNEESALSAF